MNRLAFVFVTLDSSFDSSVPGGTELTTWNDPFCQNYICTHGFVIHTLEDEPFHPLTLRGYQGLPVQQTQWLFHSLGAFPPSCVL